MFTTCTPNKNVNHGSRVSGASPFWDLGVSAWRVGEGQTRTQNFSNFVNGDKACRPARKVHEKLCSQLVPQTKNVNHGSRVSGASPFWDLGVSAWRVGEGSTFWDMEFTSIYYKFTSNIWGRVDTLLNSATNVTNGMCGRVQSYTTWKKVALVTKTRKLQKCGDAIRGLAPARTAFPSNRWT